MPEENEFPQDALPGVSIEEKVTWEETVAKWKNKATLRGALAASLVEMNPKLLNVILIWPMLPRWRNENVQPEKQISKYATEDARLFKIGWTGVKVPYDKIEDYTGMTREESEPLVGQAKSMGLIWPDGTINTTLLAYLTQKLGPEMVAAITEEPPK